MPRPKHSLVDTVLSVKTGCTRTLPAPITLSEPAHTQSNAHQQTHTHTHTHTGPVGSGIPRGQTHSHTHTLEAHCGLGALAASKAMALGGHSGQSAVCGTMLPSATAAAAAAAGELKLTSAVDRCTPTTTVPRWNMWTPVMPGTCTASARHTAWLEIPCGRPRAWTLHGSMLGARGGGGGDWGQTGYGRHGSMCGHLTLTSGKPSLHSVYGPPITLEALPSLSVAPVSPPCTRCMALPSL